LGKQPATLWDHVITTTNDIPKVFVMLLVEPPPQIRFVHITRRVTLHHFWGHNSQWDDRVFGFQGDMQQGIQINRVEWPTASFGRSVFVTVLLVDHMDVA
jgi:hypothetical protein